MIEPYSPPPARLSARSITLALPPPSLPSRAAVQESGRFLRAERPSKIPPAKDPRDATAAEISAEQRSRPLGLHRLVVGARASHVRKREVEPYVAALHRGRER